MPPFLASISFAFATSGGQAASPTGTKATITATLMTAAKNLFIIDLTTSLG
jgi:hypothetical protein